jgi:hypothetical protein
LASLRPAPWSVLAIGLVVAGAFFVSNNRSILWPDGYTGHEAALVARLSGLPSDALVISDDPGWVWRSGHRPPGAFADPSFQRIDQGRITQASLVKAASARDVCGVISSSPMHFGRFEGLGDALAAEGYTAIQVGPDITFYARDALRCATSVSALRGCADSRGGRTSAGAPPRRSRG